MLTDRAVRVFVVLLLAVLAIGCSSVPGPKPVLEDVSFQPPASTNPPYVFETERIQPAIPTDPPSEGFALPSPSELLRDLSDLPEDRYHSGSSFVEPANEGRLLIGGETVTFLPDWTDPVETLDDLAYASYAGAFGAYSGPATIYTNWQTPPAETNLFVGLANFTLDRWQWFAGSTDSALDLGSFADYTGPEGEYIAVIAVLGSAPAQLTSLRLGENGAPVVVLSADPLGGTAPLNVSFDASESFDPESGALTYEWDLDGDGVFEIPASGSGLREHTYNTGGTFNPAVRVTDPLLISTTESVAIAVTGGGGNIPPTAALSALPESGAAPLTVDFDASASSDPDGTITEYDWDFDGDGIFELLSGAAQEQHEYEMDGLYNATVRVRDDDGAATTASVDIDVSTENNPPLALFTPDYYFGDAPLLLQLDASASSDSGGITLYEWDLDGDSVYETNAGTDPLLVTTLTDAGLHTIGLRVTDNTALTGETTALITVDDGETGYDETEANDTFDTADALPPLQAAGWDGNLGTGGYDGSLNDWYTFVPQANTKVSVLMEFIDAEADLDIQLIDTDGTTVLDSSTGVVDNELVEFSFTESGTYFLRCFVYSGAPADALADYTLTLTQEGVIAPVAAFEYTPQSGTAPLTVDFDASGSTDSDGNITKYEWDFNGDGAYEFNGNGVPTTSVTFYRAGTYDVVLRVTDDDGTMDTETHSLTVDASAYMETENNDSDLEANVFPAFAFSNQLCDLGPGGNDGDTEDWFKFTVADAGTVDILMNLYDPFGDLDMKLYDSALVEIGTSTGTDNDEQITEAVTPGTYYLKCYVFSPGGGGWGGYVLAGSFTPGP